MAKFTELNLSKEIIRALEELGFQEPTKIQEEAIPAILDGKDVLGKSHTGTGKTAAFGLPAIEMIHKKTKQPQTLILCPTRELVSQVATELRKFSKYKEGVKIVPIYGGQPIDQQITLLKKGVSIIVGTPGRIMDHLNRKTLKFTDLNTVILDEADEMLNMGFKEDIEEILTSIPEDKHFQMILFSATMPKEILAITEQFQENPLHIEIKSAQRTIDTVEQTFYEVPKGKKFDALRLLYAHFEPSLTMIFANTKKMVDELVDELNKYNIKAVGLHGDMKQQSRTRVMDQFRTGNYPILIATDVAARGIDIDNIDLVINYDIPQDNEYYIHRIGRTGRAGKTGKAITLISGSRQHNDMKQIMRYTKSVIREGVLPTSTQMRDASINNYIEKVLANIDSFNQDALEIANRLLSQGVALENILSAVIAQSYHYKDISISIEPKAKRTADFKTTTLKCSLGKNHGINPGNIVAAISEESNLSSNIIGKIEVRGSYSLIDIESSQAVHVVNSMQGSQIRGKDVEITFDKGGKNSSDSSRRESSPRKRDRERSYAKANAKDSSRTRGSRDSKSSSSKRQDKKSTDKRPTEKKRKKY